MYKELKNNVLRLQLDNFDYKYPNDMDFGNFLRPKAKLLKETLSIDVNDFPNDISLGSEVRKIINNWFVQES